MEKKNILLITGTGNSYQEHPFSHWYHPYYNAILADIIKDKARIQVSSSLQDLNQCNLIEYDIVLNNSLFKEPTQVQFEQLKCFVAQGGNYFALHAGLVAFGSVHEYETFIGARYVHHDDIKTFRVNTFDAWYRWELDGAHKHPITKNIDDFYTLDELYVMQVHPGVEVIMRAEYHPIMWVKYHGEGKILCLSLGHADYSLKNEGFTQVMNNSIDWLVGS